MSPAASTSIKYGGGVLPVREINKTESRVRVLENLIEVFITKQKILLTERRKVDQMAYLCIFEALLDIRLNRSMKEVVNHKRYGIA